MTSLLRRLKWQLIHFNLEEALEISQELHDLEAELTPELDRLWTDLTIKIEMCREANLD